jgi:hypothetical protein
MDDVWLTALFQKEFDWCRVGAGESILEAAASIGRADVAAAGVSPVYVLLGG